MRALGKVIEEPPSGAYPLDVVSAEDFELVCKHIKKNKLKSDQRRLLLELEGDPHLCVVAKELYTIPEERRRCHKLFISLREGRDRQCVNNFLHFMRMVDCCLKQLNGPHGALHRQDYQNSLVSR